MKTISTVLMCACMALAAGTAAAADDTMKKDGTAKGEMTMKQCEDHMAMSKKDGVKKDAAMMKADVTCADMMKKAPTDPMKK